MRPAERVQRIAVLCGKRAIAEKLNKRNVMARIDHELKPLMTQQLQFELRQKRKQLADIAAGDLDAATEVYREA